VLKRKDRIIILLNFIVMLSLKEFREKSENIISSEDIGKFVGGYDAVRNTDRNENLVDGGPDVSTHYDRMWYNRTNDGGDTDWMYMGGNYALGEPNGSSGFYILN
jgi:hypothetical protein